MGNKNNNGKSKLGSLWLLFLDDPMKLTSVQIKKLLKAENALRVARSRVERFPENLIAIQEYRRKKEELSKLSTEELRKLQQKIVGEKRKHSAFFKDLGIERSVNDIKDRALFEPPCIDSDEYIIYEILQERKKQAASKKLNHAAQG